MKLLNKTAFKFLGVCTLLLSQAAAQQWQVSSLQASDIGTSNGTVSFTVVGTTTTSTSCSVNWTQSPSPVIPTSWTKCQSNPLLRFRFVYFQFAGNFSLEIAQVTTLITTTPATINVTHSSVILDSTSTSGFTCSTTTTGTGNSCTLNTALAIPQPVTAQFYPGQLNIYWSLSRNDGSLSGVIPCTEAWTFYISNPNVPTLGPITMGRGTEHNWLTHCDSNWACGGKDPSVNTWSSCAAPAFQFKKTLPATSGDQISNFIMSITHTFPLMMATAVRGSNAPDYAKTDQWEAAGMDVKLTLQDTVWKGATGGVFAPIIQGGIDQTGNCNLGCEFGSTSIIYISVASVEVI